MSYDPQSVDPSLKRDQGMAWNRLLHRVQSEERVMTKLLQSVTRWSFAAVLSLVPVLHSAASVSLVFSDNDATPNITTVIAGQSFNVGVKLISTSSASVDQVQSVDYFLQSTGPQAGIFTLTNRDATTGNPSPNPFDDFLNTNAVALNPPDAKLNPRNNVNLAAFLRDVKAPIGNNYGNGTTTYNPALVANYTIAVAPNAAAGTYTLSTFTNVGYSDANFTDHPFSAPPTGSPNGNTFTVVVVAAPEPSTALLFGIGSLGMLLRRRRRA
jgi:hypothetical protein